MFFSVSVLLVSLFLHSMCGNIWSKLEHNVVENLDWQTTCACQTSCTALEVFLVFWLIRPLLESIVTHATRLEYVTEALHLIVHLHCQKKKPNQPLPRNSNPVNALWNQICPYWREKVHVSVIQLIRAAFMSEPCYFTFFCLISSDTLISFLQMGLKNVESVLRGLIYRHEKFPLVICL